jgi:hypothetical protein
MGSCWSKDIKERREGQEPERKPSTAEARTDKVVEINAPKRGNIPKKSMPQELPDELPPNSLYSIR